MNTPAQPADERKWPLRAIKTIHTAAWAFFAGCIAVLPVVAVQGSTALANILAACVALECIVLAVNGGRCPLTPVAARFTQDRRPNFDIYLPQWLARWNKAIFGALFGADLVILASKWVVRTYLQR